MQMLLKSNQFASSKFTVPQKEFFCDERFFLQEMSYVSLKKVYFELISLSNH